MSTRTAKLAVNEASVRWLEEHFAQRAAGLDAAHQELKARLLDLGKAEQDVEKHRAAVQALGLDPDCLRPGQQP